MRKSYQRNLKITFKVVERAWIIFHHLFICLQVDAKLVNAEMGAERMPAEALEPLRSRYDYIPIDTRFSSVRGMLPSMALAAKREDEVRLLR